MSRVAQCNEFASHRPICWSLDLSPPWYYPVPVLGCGAILFTLAPQTPFGISAAVLSVLGALFILTIRKTVEFDRRENTATWRRQYLITLKPKTYDLTLFDGFSIDDIPIPSKGLCYVTLTAPTTSITVATFPNDMKLDALRLAEVLAYFTKLKIVKPPARPPQFHLATGIALMLLAGGSIGLGIKICGTEGKGLISIAILVLMVVVLGGTQIEFFLRRREIRMKNRQP